MKSFDEYVVSSIVKNNDFGIDKVSNIETLKSLNFDPDKYVDIEEVIKKKELYKIDSLESNNFSTNAHCLFILSIKDQNQKKYIVTVYDSDELSQDPQVIEIYPLD